MSNIHIIKEKINNNAQVMDVFSSEYLINAWEKSTGKEISQVVGNGARIGANYASAVLDIDTARRLINDFNMDGRVVLKTVKNKQKKEQLSKVKNQFSFQAQHWIILFLLILFVLVLIIQSRLKEKKKKARKKKKIRRSLP